MWKIAAASTALLLTAFFAAPAYAQAPSTFTPSTFTINPYANVFLWFGYNTYGTNVPYGTWSNCPYDPTMTPTALCSATALGNAAWDLNTQSYLTSATSTFTLTSTSTLTETFASINHGTPSTVTITYHKEGSSGRWFANPRNSVITFSGSFVYWGGVLMFSGTPSASTFVSGTFEEWAYVTPATYNASPSVYPDAVYVPSQGAYLALTSVVYASASPLTTAQINSLISNVPYLGVNPN